jgi:hypothetical protein
MPTYIEEAGCSSMRSPSRAGSSRAAGARSRDYQLGDAEARIKREPDGDGKAAVRHTERGAPGARQMDSPSTQSRGAHAQRAESH